MLARAARLACAAALGAFAAGAFALDTPDWPPPESVEAHMHRLQEEIRAAQSTPGEREAARKELSGLLKSPAGRARGPTRGERRARAAIVPLPSVVRPLPPATAPPPSDVARVEVVAPPPRPVDPQTGAVVVPSGGFAIDPLTGHVLHPVPGGYVDPRTGRVIR